MGSLAVNRIRDREARLESPTGRILSAADFAELLAVQRNRRGTDEEHIGRLPSLHEQARQHGYQQGVCRVMSELKSTLAELQAYYHDHDAWMQHFVFAIVRKVLGQNDAESLVPLIVQQVIEECDRSLETILVHVHPDVASVVAKRLAKLTSKGPQIDIVSDERLTELGCEVHTPFGIVDAGLYTQMDALEYAMRSPDSVVTDA